MKDDYGRGWVTKYDVWLQPEGLRLRQRRPRGTSHARSIQYQRASYNGHTHTHLHLHSQTSANPSSTTEKRPDGPKNH